MNITIEIIVPDTLGCDNNVAACQSVFDAYTDFISIARNKAGLSIDEVSNQINFFTVVPNNDGLVSNQKVSKFPTVFFIRDNYLVARLEGNQVAKENVLALIEKVFFAVDGNGNGQFSTEDGTKFGAGNELQIGLIGFGSSIKLPKGVWLFAAAAAGYKSLSTDKQIPKILWSALGIFATSKYLKND